MAADEMAAMDQDPVEERIGARPRRVLAIVAGALFIALLLNASELEREAKAKPFGTERDVWVAVWKPFAAVSRALYLDRPREWADQALNREEDDDIFALPSATPAASETPAPVVPAQLVRTPTVQEPLRVWIGGDSMMKVLGESFVREASQTGLIEPVHEPQLESGLARPDFFDWPKELNRLASSDVRYEVFVVMFGANDAQGLIAPNGTIHQDAGTPGWVAEYRRRVGGVMDLLRGDGRFVVWVGQPIMRSAGLSEDMAMMNQVYLEEAATRPWVRFVDLWPLFADAGGAYDAYIADDDGEVKLMRNPDGVHFVRDGGDRAARAILKVIKAEAKLE